jgi:ubiquinol-cytochrome c reductase cytochrome b subunit
VKYHSGRGLLLGPLAVALLLGGLAWQKDAVDEDYQAAMTRAKVDAELARSLARDGVPPGGAAEQLRLHPPRRGAALFAVHCQGCHALDGKGGGEAPDLTGYLTPAWLQGVIRTPRDPRYFGATKLDDMPPLEREHWSKLPALAAFVRAQDPAMRPRLDPKLVEQGDAAYFELECHGCHPVKPGEVGSAPNLAGYGTAEWLREFLKAPAADRFYGELNDMPHYEGELAPDELDALVVFLRGRDPAAAPFVAGVAAVTSR